MLEAFLSSSFHEDDKEVVEAIKEILSELGIKCYQAENVPRIPDDIIKMILNYRLYIAVLTPRKAEEISPAVTFEVGVALSHDRQVIILREDSVPIQTFYPDRLQKLFNRTKLLEQDKDELSKIKKTIVELGRWYGYELGELDPELEARYNFARIQAHSLGSTILGYFNEMLYRNEVRERAVKNFPTKADIRANRMILEAIEKDSRTVNDGIVSEESIKDVKSIEKTIENSEFVWVIDPLDGTLNFAYGFPFFCVSLGLIRNRTPVLGVIYNPTTQELYCGRQGYASECFDLRSGIKRTLELKSKKSKLEDCIVMSHLSGLPEPRRKMISVLDQLMESCRSVRMLGSGQMALVSLALGQFDIFFNYQTNVWDIVPGYVILKGAGGYATSTLEVADGWDWKSQGILAASNSVIGEKFREFMYAKFKSDFPTY